MINLLTDSLANLESPQWRFEMTGNLNRQVVGKCGKCGGVVSVPTIFWSVKRPVPQCEKCGRYADEAAHLPVIPMQPDHKQWGASVREQKREQGEGQQD